MNNYTRETIAAAILAALEQGNIAAWVKPWREVGKPQSYDGGHVYRGVNLWTASAAMLRHGYTSPRFLSAHCASKHGGHVKAGEKERATPIVIFKQYVSKSKRDAEGEPVRGLFARVYEVYNEAQCEGLPVRERAPVPALHMDAEAIVSRYLANGGPSVEVTGDEAIYYPTLDLVRVPNVSQFASVSEYYAALFHELAHSTGHAKRLAREGITEPVQWASHNYSAEELVAEFSAAMLTAEAGLDVPVANSIAYIAGWRNALAHDPGAAIVGASRADKAVGYILGEVKHEN